MIRLTDLRGHSYYITEANIPERYQRGDELVDVVEFLADEITGDWVECFTDRFLMDRIAVRADQIYLAVEVEAPQ